MKPVSILLVEDDQLDVTEVIRSLNKLNIVYKLHPVKNGEEAVSFLQNATSRKEMPDFAIIDINMPKMNGLELLQKIRENPDWTHLKCFMLTTSNDKTEKKQTQSIGVAGFITKPLRLNSGSMDGFNLMIDLINTSKSEA